MAVYENLSTPLIPAQHRNVWETEVAFWLNGRKKGEVRKQLFVRRELIAGFEIVTPEVRLDLIRKATDECLNEILFSVKQGVLHYQDEETGEIIPFEFAEWWVS